MQTAQATLVDRIRGAVDVLVREMAKFGVVGAVAFVVDFGLFNVLVHAGGTEAGILAAKPLTAKAISVSVSTVVAWVGNRHWTFRHRRQLAAHHELLLYVMFNVVGMVIALTCLGFGRYVLGQHSIVSDNFWGNGVGLVLGTLFRFWAYRRFVFGNAALEPPEV